MAFALLAVYGYQYLNDYLLGREHFPALKPGAINVLGVDTSQGYRIVVQNQTAKLVYGTQENFGPGPMENTDADDTDKKFIPIKELLKGLQGDVGGLSYFVQRLNDIKDDSLPAQAKVWKLEDIEKALAGDKAIEAKLVNDLNVKLDGTPLDHLSVSAFFNGIIVDSPVPMEVPVGDRKEPIVARVHQPYRASFLTSLEANIKEKFATRDLIAKEYMLAAERVRQSETQKENVRRTLSLFRKRIPQLGPFPQKILNSVTPVINEQQIVGARFETENTSKGDRYTLVLELTDEGKKRLWQFTRDRVNSQLLITVDGVAIAAPIIAHRIADTEISVRGLEDRNMVEDAVATINAKRATKTND